MYAREDYEKATALKDINIRPKSAYARNVCKIQNMLAFCQNPENHPTRPPKAHFLNKITKRELLCRNSNAFFYLYY